MDVKAGLQRVADSLAVEAATLVHVAEQHIPVHQLKSFLGKAAACGGELVQRVVDELSSVDAQGRTDFTDYPE